jgi:hypothetical protein
MKEASYYHERRGRYWYESGFRYVWYIS